MITHVSSSPSTIKRSGLFRGPDGGNLLVTFILVTTLFLLWGFCNGMIDILNKHFQDSLHISKEQSGLVQFANYLAYFLMAIPAGLIARKFGYKGGILLGLVLIASGAFWFIHAVSIGKYSAFLLGLRLQNQYAQAHGLPVSTKMSGWKDTQTIVELGPLRDSD